MKLTTIALRLDCSKSSNTKEDAALLNLLVNKSLMISVILINTQNRDLFSLYTVCL